VLLDYGVGNLRSVERALQAAGAVVTRSADIDVVDDDVSGGSGGGGGVAGLVLPGVGAFQAAKERLGSRFEALRAYAHAGRPLLGICLGMQLLFDESHEHGSHAGLGLIPGVVQALPKTVVVPHMGWSRTSTGEVVYFCHSFAAPKVPETTSTAEHGVVFSAAVQRGNVRGYQFHPEKSGPAGIALLKNWLDVFSTPSRPAKPATSTAPPSAGGAS
jgi:glutamine amidotransferase